MSCCDSEVIDDCLEELPNLENLIAKAKEVNALFRHKIVANDISNGLLEAFGE
jgi:hypothetical protein